VLVRPAGTLLESDSPEEAWLSISTVLEKSITSRIISHLTSSILGFLLFARVPARDPNASLADLDRARRTDL
jgi:hypothetical protein